MLFQTIKVNLFVPAKGEVREMGGKLRILGRGRKVTLMGAGSFNV